MRAATIALGVGLGLAVSAFGCGPISQTHHPPGNSHAVETGPVSRDLPLARISITDGKVSPRPGRIRVSRGEHVRISVVSDRPDTVHVHGFDIERRLTPRRAVVLSFTADRTGVFDIETHDSDLLLTQLAVQ